mgnify:CR=1 FL=1
MKALLFSICHITLNLPGEVMEKLWNLLRLALAMFNKLKLLVVLTAGHLYVLLAS